MTLPDDAGDTLDPALAEYHLGLILGALPALEDAAATLARRDAIRTAFLAMRPRNPMEAMMAAEAIIAHHAIMDCFRVALLPDTDPAVAARARTSAATLSRVRLATLRALQRPPASAPAAARPRTPAKRSVDPIPEPPAPEPIPTQERSYVPRDRFGNQIPPWRWSDMTMVQRRAAFADPAQTALREAALAEEAAIIAAQTEADASVPLPVDGAEVTPQPAVPR
jgi:hypothetical protein